jgi:hypothetical protein
VTPVDGDPEVLDQEGDVLAPVAKRRQLEHDVVESVVEILAEAACSMAASRSRWVAEISLTSTLTVRVDPTDRSYAPRRGESPGNSDDLELAGGRAESSLCAWECSIILQLGPNPEMRWRWS